MENRRKEEEIKFRRNGGVGYMEIKSYKNGTFCYCELSTKKYEKSKEFYKNIFDWEVKENKEILKYTLFYKGEHILLGMYDSEDEQLEIDFSNTWLPFISVSDIEKAIEKVIKHGGKCLQESFEAENYGRASIIEDPTGALFSLWEPNSYKGSALQRELNTLSWCELHTTDIEVAAKFYEKVFSWKREVHETEVGTYINFKKGGDYVAGIRELGEYKSIEKPIWMMYIEVGDCRKTYKKALKSGAEMIQAPKVYEDSTGKVETAILKDISGAIFAIGHRIF